jgi:arsenate reductase
MEIWINPACSKCRSALTLLDAEGADYTVRRYLEDVPSEDEIRAVLERLGLEPWDIVRTGEPAAKDLGLKSWPRTAESRERWIAALAEHPNVVCKISGVVEAAAPDKVTADDVAPVINHCLDRFGPDRVIFASNWPVCNRGGSLATWVGVLRGVVAGRNSGFRRKLFHDNAMRLYALR